MSRLVRAFEEAIATAGDLKRNHLHICTALALYHVLVEIIDNGRAVDICETEVADWCARQPELTVERRGYMWHIMRKEIAINE